MDTAILLESDVVPGFLELWSKQGLQLSSADLCPRCGSIHLAKAPQGSKDYPGRGNSHKGNVSSRRIQLHASNDSESVKSQGDAGMVLEEVFVGG
jgi:hypothetical protein